MNNIPLIFNASSINSYRVIDIEFLSISLVNIYHNCTVVDYKNKGKYSMK